MMSEMPVSPGESENDSHTLPFPAYPAAFPQIHEAFPTVSQRFLNHGASVSPSLPQRGRRETPTGKHPLGRTPQPRTCPTCAETILTGLDANRAALTVQLDPYPLTPTGEIWALQNQRGTWQITQGEIEKRDRWNIPGRPPSTTLTVLTSHKCGQPPPHQHRRTTNPPPVAQPQENPWPPF